MHVDCLYLPCVWNFPVIGLTGLCSYTLLPNMAQSKNRIFPISSAAAGHLRSLFTLYLHAVRTLRTTRTRPAALGELYKSGLIIL